MGSSELISSSRKIGQLYPVLVDSYGNVIDGEHRLDADANWRKSEVTNIKTEKDRIIARIVCNNIRRVVSAQEKREQLERLAEIHLKEGIENGSIAYEIASETGMSYRWVVKYLPNRYKDCCQSKNAMSAARYAAKPCDSSRIDTFFRLQESCQKFIERVPPNKRFLEPKYASADYTIYAMNKILDCKIVQAANILMIEPNMLVQKIIQRALKEIENLANEDLTMNPHRKSNNNSQIQHFFDCMSRNK